MSKDKSISLELIGSENDIANAKVTLKISMAGSQKLSADKRQVVISFIDNIFGQAPQNADWLDENLAKLNGGSSAYRSLIKDDKVIEISKDAQNNLVFVAKPYQKKTVREVL